MTETEEKTEFKFSELSESAKETARNKYRYGDYPYDEWWDAVYGDAVRMGAMLGITISTTTLKGRMGKSYQTTNIYFSGFCSQGDGASFEGRYRFRLDAVEQIVQETTDEELLRIATELTLINVTRRLQTLGGFSISVTTSDNYSHSNTMQVELTMDDDSTEDTEPNLEELEDELLILMRDFADWIYKQLEAEHDYLMSDEVVDQALEDDLFDEDGCMI